MEAELGYSVTGADLMRWGLPYLTWGEAAHADLGAAMRGGGLAVLYEGEPHRGHWVLLLSRPDGSIEFLDPYGLAPDDELDYAGWSARQGRGSHLLRAALEAGARTVDYLGTPLQQWRPGVNTCGRYVLARWLDRGAPLAAWLRRSGLRAKELARNDARIIELTRGPLA